MAKVRLMYWKEVPVQVQAEDADGQVSKQLDERFQHGVDTISMFDGSGGSEEESRELKLPCERKLPYRVDVCASSAALLAISSTTSPGTTARNMARK